MEHSAANILLSLAAWSLILAARETGHDMTIGNGTKVTNVGETTSFRASCFTRVYPASIYLTFYPHFRPTRSLTLSYHSFHPVHCSSPTSLVNFFHSCPLLLFLPWMKNKWCCTAWRPDADADADAVVFHGISPCRSVLRFRLPRRYYWSPRLSIPDLLCSLCTLYSTIACHDLRL